MKKKRFLILSILIGLLVLSACAEKDKKLESPYAGVPEDAYSFMVDYLESARDGYSKLVDLDYYPEGYEWAKELTMQSPEYVIDYEIESAEKINDNLYAFVFRVKTDATLDQYTRCVNFVGRIDGELYRIANTTYIPDVLRDGLDEEKYSFDALQENAAEEGLLEYFEVLPDEMPYTLCVDDITGTIAEWLEQDCSEIPAAAMTALRTAYTICAEALENNNN